MARDVRRTSLQKFVKKTPIPREICTCAHTQTHTLRGHNLNQCPSHSDTRSLSRNSHNEPAPRGVYVALYPAPTPASFPGQHRPRGAHGPSPPPLDDSCSACTSSCIASAFGASPLAV